jgi:hypothetical protein
VIPTGGSRHPAILVVVGDAPEIVAVEFVEAGAAQAELVGRGESGNFVAAEGGEDFSDQRSTQKVRELAIMFFIAARMWARPRVGEFGVPGPAGLKPASATLRPASGPLGPGVFAFARTLVRV